nr:hypothetical protein [uncultured Ottowia sp.]
MSDWESMMTTLRLNPPARLGAHLLAQQRIPHAALTPAGKGVVNLFPGRIVLGQRALLTASGLAACGLHMEDGVDHVPGAALTDILFCSSR